MPFPSAASPQIPVNERLYGRPAQKFTLRKDMVLELHLGPPMAAPPRGSKPIVTTGGAPPPPLPPGVAAVAAAPAPPRLQPGGGVTVGTLFPPPVVRRISSNGVGAQAPNAGTAIANGGAMLGLNELIAAALASGGLPAAAAAAAAAGLNRAQSLGRTAGGPPVVAANGHGAAVEAMEVEGKPVSLLQQQQQQQLQQQAEGELATPKVKEEAGSEQQPNSLMQQHEADRGPVVPHAGDKRQLDEGVDAGAPSASAAAPATAVVSAAAGSNPTAAPVPLNTLMAALAEGFDPAAVAAAAVAAAAATAAGGTAPGSGAETAAAAAAAAADAPFRRPGKGANGENLPITIFRRRGGKPTLMRACSGIVGSKKHLPLPSQILQVSGLAVQKALEACLLSHPFARTALYWTKTQCFCRLTYSFQLCHNDYTPLQLPSLCYAATQALPVPYRTGVQTVSVRVVYLDDDRPNDPRVGAATAAAAGSPHSGTEEMQCFIGPTGSHGCLSLQIPITQKMHNRKLRYTKLEPDLTVELGVGEVYDAAAPAAGTTGGAAPAVSGGGGGSGAAGASGSPGGSSAAAVAARNAEAKLQQLMLQQQQRKQQAAAYVSQVQPSHSSHEGGGATTPGKGGRGRRSEPGGFGAAGAVGYGGWREASVAASGTEDEGDGDEAMSEGVTAEAENEGVEVDMEGVRQPLKRQRTSEFGTVAGLLGDTAVGVGLGARLGGQMLAAAGSGGGGGGGSPGLAEGRLAAAGPFAVAAANGIGPAIIGGGGSGSVGRDPLRRRLTGAPSGLGLAVRKPSGSAGGDALDALAAAAAVLGQVERDAAPAAVTWAQGAGAAGIGAGGGGGAAAAAAVEGSGVSVLLQQLGADVARALLAGINGGTGGGGGGDRSTLVAAALLASSLAAAAPAPQQPPAVAGTPLAASTAAAMEVDGSPLAGQLPTVTGALAVSGVGLHGTPDSTLLKASLFVQSRAKFFCQRNPIMTGTYIA